MDNTDTRTILINDDVLDEHAAIAERMATTAARLEADIRQVETKIHRFPRSLRGIGGDDKDRYIVPSVVAIWPYHHGSPHLRKMEEVKLAWAYYFCQHSGCSTAEVYEKVRSVAGAAWRCYDADDPAVVGLGDAEFAAMMFLDGCFLLQYMVADDADMTASLLRNRMTLSTGPSIQKDMFLLENQIPWLVLDALKEFEFLPVDVQRFVDGMGEKFLPGLPGKGRKSNDGRYRRRRRVVFGTGTKLDKPPPPPHLLGLLLCYTQIRSEPAHVKSYREFHPPLKSSNAVELAEIGVKLTPSTKPWISPSGMKFHRSYLFGELSLSPVLLNDTTACWLVNLAALEEANTSGASEEYSESDNTYVSSYLFMLATLMDTEEEVQQMRSNYILHSTLSNKQALRFFKDLADHLRFGDPYINTMEEISSYRRQVCIAIYRFIYKNYRSIVAVLSVAGVLCSILNALYSLKKPYKT